MLFCMFGFSSHKLVVKPQKKLKAPSKGSAVEKKTSAILAHTFHTVITCYFMDSSKFSITCCHFKQSFRGLCRFHCQFVFILFFISKTYLKPALIFLFASFKFLNTFFSCTSTWMNALDTLILKLCQIIILLFKVCFSVDISQPR